MNSITVPASDLKVGDFLRGSQRRVVWVGYTPRTPPQMVTVMLTNAKGKVSGGDWWKRTRINGVERTTD